MCPGPPLVPERVVADLLAVLPEALSNTARHAHATRTTVDVAVTPDLLTARVEDDGRGIGDTIRLS